MKGEKDFANAVETGISEIHADTDSFYGTHPLKRAAIAVAGPAANIIFAWLAFVIISMSGYAYYTTSAKIAIPDEADFFSPAREAGLKSGDIITKINGITISDFSDLHYEIAIRPDEDIKISVDRDGENLEFTVHSSINKKEGNGFIGIMSTGTFEKKYTKTYSFFPAMYQGAKETGKMIHSTIKSIGILFKGVDVSNAVSGPARISSMLGESAVTGFSENFKTGLAVTLQFLALINISLFIMNLLPIPILDGGIVLFALLQFITKKQVSPKTQYSIQKIGIVFIAALFLIGLSGDVKYFISKFRG